VLLAFVGLKTPKDDTFGIVYGPEETLQIMKVRDALEKKDYLRQHDKKNVWGKLLAKKNHSMLNEYQIKNIKRKRNTVYYEPPSLVETKVAEGSLVINLLPKAPNEQLEKGICVCENLTRVSVKNYGAPMAYLHFKKVVVKYIKKKKTRKLYGIETKMPLHIDLKEEAQINISEITANFEDALCDVRNIDPKLHATMVQYCDDFFFYKNITFTICATSVYGAETTYKVTMKRTGEMLTISQKTRLFSISSAIVILYTKWRQSLQESKTKRSKT